MNNSAITRRNKYKLLNQLVISILQPELFNTRIACLT